MKIAILGGGITGLSLAYHILRFSDDESIQIHLFEKDSVPGGFCRTLTYGDHRFDLGPHNFHSRVPGFHTVMQNLIGDRYKEHHFTTQVSFNDRFIPYPMS